MKQTKYYSALCLLISWPVLASNACHPAVDGTRAQFIVGYGSLMQEQSKREDASQVSDNTPIYVQGFKRGWFIQGRDEGVNATYLAVIKAAGANLNAVYFKLNSPKAMQAYDAREDGYCRVLVAPSALQPLKQQDVPQGQYWIYTVQQEHQNRPSAQYPIYQSYVDIFLDGCITLAEQYHQPNFARDCIQLTTGWSEDWVDDRSHPKHPIDDLLAAELPDYYKRRTSPPLK